MNKEEVIDELENAIPDFILNEFQIGKETGLTYALELVKQLNDPEKPVVPQFVADWYEKNRDDLESSLFSLCVDFYKRELQDDLHNWFRYSDNKPIETLVRMKFFGYEIEKEKLYTVELPNPNAGGHVVLCKTSDGIVSITFASIARWRGGKNVQLTESEIKQDFEWAWKFAEEVKE